MFLSLNVHWDSRLRSCCSLLANSVWSCVWLHYLAFLFVPTAANPSLSFHFPSFNMELFLALSWRFYLSHSLSFPRSPPATIIKYLKWRKGCLTSNTILYSSSPSQLRGTLGPSFLEESFLSQSFFLSPSFHLTLGAFDVIIGCSACVCTWSYYRMKVRTSVYYVWPVCLNHLACR